ncbi:MAG: DUF1015 domain-containing protein, partial [Kiritimatiellae bacterium]|nr:DUF1015 domain-containing protein [Kiritimatiellia bacterium]
AAKLAEGNMLSFLRVARPEIELDPSIDVHDDRVYAKAAENFKRLCEAAPLEVDPEKHLYVYSLKMGDHVQTGILGAASTEDYDNDIIKKHEKTRKDKEDDRTRHVTALRSHTGPVFLTYKDDVAVDAIVASITATEALFDFTAPDGIGHKLWRVDEETSAKLADLFENIPYLYIADGHHRAASASRAAAECRNNNPGHTGEEDYNFFLTVVFPGSQLKILPYNRAVHDLNGLSTDEFMEKVSANFAISDTDEPVAQDPGDIRMYLDGKWYKLDCKAEIPSDDVIATLDVSMLQDYILAPVLGVADPRTSKKIDFVGGIRGTGELEKLVNSGKAAVAFSMYPTTVEQLMAIADAGEIMPPKSTWFEPKLRDGMVCHNF